MSTVKYPPLTVEEAVDYLQANLSLNYEMQLTSTKKEDLDDLHHSVGAYASGTLGVWSGNDALIDSCRSVSGDKDLSADEVSMMIIGQLWERLQNNNDVEVVRAANMDEDEMETIDFKEALISEIIQSDALINLLDRKGIITKKELHEEIIRLKESMVKVDR